VAADDTGHPAELAAVRTPAEERQFQRDVDSLTMRFGEWYRIWPERGLWWASRDGDKLSADSPLALAIVIGDHMALRKALAAGWTPPEGSGHGG
jgi:hypothetical protein